MPCPRMLVTRTPCIVLRRWYNVSLASGRAIHGSRLDRMLDDGPAATPRSPAGRHRAVRYEQRGDAVRRQVDDDALREVLSDYARALALGDYDVGQVMFDLADQCTAILAVDGAGVCLDDGSGELHFLSATDGRAARLEEAQITHQDGPCFTAYRTGKLISVDDIGGDDRWPAYRDVALELGYGSVLGVPMPVRAETIGALNLYRDDRGPWDPSVLETAATLSNMATGYVTMSRALADAQVLTSQLQHALDTRVVVEQAKGVLVAQLGITPAEAYERLRTHTRAQRRRVHDVALDVVDGTLTLPPA